MEKTGAKKCLECGQVFYGRTDKKFCSSDCKNKYHNRYDHSGSRLRERMYMDLSINHRILENLMKIGMTSINLYDIETLGFKPALITGYVRKRKYDELRCFDISYRQTPERIFEIKAADLEEVRRVYQTPPPQSYGTHH